MRGIGQAEVGYSRNMMVHRKIRVEGIKDALLKAYTARSNFKIFSEWHSTWLFL
jgi:hypothetical protein